MTVQIDSQPVTDHIVWYNDMCFIYNSISFLEKKTTVRNTLSDMLILSFYGHKRYTVSELRASSEDLLRCWRSNLISNTNIFRICFFSFFFFGWDPLPQFSIWIFQFQAFLFWNGPNHQMNFFKCWHTIFNKPKQ